MWVMCGVRGARHSTAPPKSTHHPPTNTRYERSPPAPPCLPMRIQQGCAGELQSLPRNAHLAVQCHQRVGGVACACVCVCV